MMKPISRREFLRLLLLGSGGAVLNGCKSLPATATATPAPGVPTTTRPAGEPVATSEILPAITQASGEFVPDVEIDLTVSQRQVQILPGQATAVWTYQGTVTKGEASNLQPLPNSYLGPLIRVRKGQKVRLRFSHTLVEPSIIHWHGLLVPSKMDGHPRDAIQAGETYVYEFEVVNRAGTYWFHPHPEPLTGVQVLRGLAGLLLVSDDEEAAAGLPSGEYDVPLVIQDRTFDQNNQFLYVQGDSMAGMPGMERMMGFLGERILVNGQADPLLLVATRVYRLRLLNGSNSRLYKLAWDNGAPMAVIATDGGLMESAVQRPYVMLGPGERIELWVDFRSVPVGTEFVLQSLAFAGAEGDSLMEANSGMPAFPATAEAGPMPGMGEEMGHGNMPGTAATPTPMDGMGAYHPRWPNGAAFPILRVRVDRQETETVTLPVRLSTIERHRMEQAVNADQPRRFGLTLHNAAWLINGRPFELENVAPDEIVKLNTLEAWEFVNELNPNEMMERMGMVHPLHIHGVQFQVIERQLLVPELKAGWDSVREGYVDEGWKDTVLLMPGERVRLLLRFDFPGLFLFHCHNLEHEDLGMMRNYRVDP